MRGKGDNVSRRRRSTGDRPGDRPRFISSSTNSSSRQANQLDGYRSQSRPRVPWHIVVHQRLGTHTSVVYRMCVARLRPPRQPPDGPRATGPNSMGSPPCGGVHRSSRSRCDRSPKRDMSGSRVESMPGSVALFRDGHLDGTYCAMFGTKPLCISGPLHSSWSCPLPPSEPIPPQCHNCEAVRCYSLWLLLYGDGGGMGGVQGAWGCDPLGTLILSAPPSFAPPDPIREHHPAFIGVPWLPFGILSGFGETPNGGNVFGVGGIHRDHQTKLVQAVGTSCPSTTV